MRRIAVSAMRERVADVIERVAANRERVVLTRHGREVAAIVPIEDLERLERADVRAQRRGPVAQHHISWQRVTDAFHQRRQ